MPKHSGGFRPIFNLRSLNQWVAYEHFKMEGIATIKEVVKQGDWMTRLDLKDAYLTIPIHPKEQKFFQFVWRGRKYQFVSLPFGLSSAPRLFTKLLRPVSQPRYRSSTTLLVAPLSLFVYQYNIM